MTYPLRKTILTSMSVLIFAGALLGFSSDSIANTPQQLLSAVTRQDLGLVKRLLANGVDVNAQDTSGWTALHNAAGGTFVYGASPEIVTVLLEAGAHVNVQNNVGQTPLHRAAFHGRLENIKLLLAAGANVYLRDTFGHLPYQLANIQGQTAAATLLRNYEQGMPQRLWQAARSDDDATVKILLSNGVDANVQNAQGETALHIASRSGSTFTHAVLLQAEVDLEVQDNNGWTALHHATWGSYNPNSPLHLVNAVGFPAYVTALLEAGANVNAQDKQGRTALQLAQEIRAENIAQIIRDYVAAMPQKFWDAITQDDLDLVKRLLANGIDVHMVNGERGQTPLHVAASGGRNAIVTALLEAGANVNTQDTRGRTPLHWAGLQWSSGDCQAPAGIRGEGRLAKQGGPDSPARCCEWRS